MDIVLAAWDFGRINELYRNHIEVLERYPQRPGPSEEGAKVLHLWAVQEREAWHEAVAHDPLLPKRLLPPGYEGVKAWERRVVVLKRAAVQAAGFKGLEATKL